jgi:hypothetical protein
MYIKKSKPFINGIRYLKSRIDILQVTPEKAVWDDEMPMTSLELACQLKTYLHSA